MWVRLSVGGSAHQGYGKKQVETLMREGGSCSYWAPSSLCLGQPTNSFSSLSVEISLGVGEGERAESGRAVGRGKPLLQPLHGSI